MIDRWIELTHLLEDAGHEPTMEGTPGCPVLYLHTDKGAIIGVDLETVVLYRDRGPENMPFEVLMLEHGGDAAAIKDTVATLARMRFTSDATYVIDVLVPRP